MAGRGGASLASVNPFFVMAETRRDRRFRRLEIFEFFFRQQNVSAVVGQQHAIISDEQRATVPLWNALLFPQLRFAFALVPRQLHARHTAAWTVLVSRRHV